ncbi:MAG: SHOCT domain-containing protein [Rhodococcus sp. (in: high G+C Gram-positive bacteria)]
MPQNLTPDAEQSVESIAQRYGLSRGAVETMLVAVNIGGGTMAQFNIPELGGGGQWMRGGMTMVGNMFDHGLKQRVDNLCGELSALLGRTQVFAAPVGSSNGAGPGGGGSGNNWWPDELGSPSSSGGQNDARYAVFPRVKRLAIQSAGEVTVYDTQDHSIGGVSQQQGSGPRSLLFSSQYGQFDVTHFPQVSTDSRGRANPTLQQPEPQLSPPPQFSPPAQRNDSPQQWTTQPEQRPSIPDLQNIGDRPDGDEQRSISADDIVASIEALAGLHARGILTDDEFSAKKADLLSRL